MNEKTMDLLTVRTSGQWHEYFLRNAAQRLEVPWEQVGQGDQGLGAQADELSHKERKAVAGSLQAWQLGETSDGRHLLAAAERYAHRQQDPLFIEVVRLFIREEQSHGTELGKFLDVAGIPRIRRNWGDSMFRAIRYCLPSMELWATVVIMVETLALIFYKAIRDATRSPRLRPLCNQILHDEVHHIRFQYERLAILLRCRPRMLLQATYGLHRVLFSGIVIAVWLGHYRALRAGGLTFRDYWQGAWLRMRFAWLRMDPSRYCWAEPEIGRGSAVVLAADP